MKGYSRTYFVPRSHKFFDNTQIGIFKKKFLINFIFDKKGVLLAVF